MPKISLKALPIALATLSAVVGLSVALPVRADLASAQKAYYAGQYEKAFRDYRELAELGQPAAQFNLSVMYAKGQGVRLSNTFAYAWAVLAEENGFAQAREMVDTLRPLLSPVSLQIAEEIRSQFNQKALNARLVPEVAETEDAPGHERCKLVQPYYPRYPQSALYRGVEGRVYVELTALADGRARNPRVVYAVPGGLFEATARKAVLHAKFAPTAQGDGATSCTTGVLYQFVITGASASDYPDLEHYANETLSKAQAGDVGAQTLYGMLVDGLPQLQSRRREALPWFLKAAQAGQPFAQYEVGVHTLEGHGCQCDANKGLIWLEKAAAADQADAQVMLATYALRGTPTAENVKRAALWLERAAANGNPDSKLYLAALLAAAPVAALHDPKRALRLANDVVRDVEEDPTVFEVRAAAKASLGDFAGSAKDESRAIDMARRLSWDVKSLEERLATYQSRHTWQGFLLMF